MPRVTKLVTEARFLTLDLLLYPLHQRYRMKYTLPQVAKV